MIECSKVTSDTFGFNPYYHYDPPKGFTLSPPSCCWSNDCGPGCCRADLIDVQLMVPPKIKVCETGFWLGSGGRPAGRDGGRPVGRSSVAPVSSAAPKKKHLIEAAPFGRLDQMLRTTV